MNTNDASRIISVIDKRIEKHVGSEGRTDATWGEVCGISEDGKYVSAYLFGDTETPSRDFRLPSHLAVSVGDKVKVGWNVRGERVVFDVAIASDYPKLKLNPNTGEILTGDGVAPPQPLDLGAGVEEHEADPNPHPQYLSGITVWESNAQKVVSAQRLDFGLGFAVDSEWSGEEAEVSLDLSEVAHNTLGSRTIPGAHPASAVDVADSAGYLDASNVETALAELARGHGMWMRRTTSHTVNPSAYTVAQSYNTTIYDSGTYVTYDGVNELVVNRAGLYLVWMMTQWANNTTGIRILAPSVNDTTTAQPSSEYQFRWPVGSDASQDHVWALVPLPLVANDRVSLKLWQNTGGSLNTVMYDLGVFYFGG